MSEHAGQTTDAEQVALILRKVLHRQDQLIALLTALANNLNERLRTIEERERWIDNYQHVPPPEEYQHLPPASHRRSTPSGT